MNFFDLAKAFELIEGTSQRLGKTAIIADVFRRSSDDDLPLLALLFNGRVFPFWDERKVGLSEKLVIKAVSLASGSSDKVIVDLWRNIGDIGLVAEKVISGKSQATLFSEVLTVKSVISTLRKVAGVEGVGAVDQKVRLVSKLLSSAKPLEARYIVRLVLEDLRIGVAESTIRDAVAWAFLFSPEEVNYDSSSFSINPVSRDDYNKVLSVLQSALDKTNDFSEVVLVAKNQGLDGLLKVRVVPGKPLKVMLAQKVDSLDEGFERVGVPCALEFKYDGFRLQVHKLPSGEVRLFTRRLENVTKQFPEVVSFVNDFVKADSFIIDSEAVGVDPVSHRYRPFQEISQRIKRKYNIHDLAKRLPVELNVFDILFLDGEEVLGKSFVDRRSLLKKIITESPGKIRLSEQLITSSKSEAEAFYQRSLDSGNEGVMLKNLSAPYKPGSRVGTMIKLKPVLETLDLVIVGAEWGTGKRSGWLTSFTLACRDGDSFKVVGKLGTGLKEKDDSLGSVTFQEITNRLKPLIVSTTGREVVVKPSVVVEVKYEEVQASTNYDSGFALRFPRLVRLRDDRGPSDISTLEVIRSIYLKQRGRGLK